MMALATVQNQYLDGSYGHELRPGDRCRQVDEEVTGSSWTSAYQDAVHACCEDNREMLDKIAAYLLEKETITGQEMMAIHRGPGPCAGGQLRRHPGEAQQGTAGRRRGAARPQRAHDQRAAGESLRSAV